MDFHLIERISQNEFLSECRHDLLEINVLCYLRKLLVLRAFPPLRPLLSFPSKLSVVYLESGFQLGLGRNKTRDHSDGVALLYVDRKVWREECVQGIAISE